MHNRVKPVSLTALVFATVIIASPAFATDKLSGPGEAVIGGLIINNTLKTKDRDDVPRGYRSDPKLPEVSTLTILAVGMGLVGLRLRRKH